MEELEKYVKTVSTEIMSGKGPDLISVSYLPYQKYIDKGVLLNLSDIMKEDTGFKSGDYYANILDACKYKGNLYAMPINFMFSSFIADKQVLNNESISIDVEQGWTVDDFLAISEKVTKDTNCDGAVDRYASELGRTSIMDAQVLSIVQTETKPFFSGTKSAEDTASRIQKKVETYLNE